MSENDKITEETANDTLPAEVETDLAEQETDVMPAEPEEEEIAPEDVKIFGMPRHVFHWTAIGAAGGYILADNTLWDGHVIDHAYDRDAQTLGIRAFNDLVAADTECEKVIIPMRDGITLIHLKDK